MHTEKIEYDIQQMFKAGIKSGMLHLYVIPSGLQDIFRHCLYCTYAPCVKI